MEKKEHINSNPRGVCEKLFDAITVSPGFRQFRRISYHSQDPVAAPHKSPASLLPPSVDTVSKIVPVQSKSGTSSVQTEKPDPGKGKNAPHKSAPSKNVVAEPVPAKGDPQPLLPLSFSSKLNEKPSDPVKSKKKLDTDSPPKTVSNKGKGSAKVHQLEGKSEQDRKSANTESPEVGPATKGEGEKKGGFGNINEKANEYIARAKMKLMHTTTIAGGDSNARTASFK